MRDNNIRTNTVSAYRYTIQYKPGKENSNADALSRHPAPGSKEPPKPAEVMHLMEYLDSSPVSSAQIRTWTDQDPLMSKVKRWILSGWLDPVITPAVQNMYKRCRSRKCIRGHIPMRAIFAVLIYFFIPVLSRTYFTSRTPKTKS